MKIRTCFVSNSSSSSFIISVNEKDKAISQGLKLFLIDDVIEKIKNKYTSPYGSQLIEDMNDIPLFLNYFYVIDIIRDLEIALEDNADGYITEAFDRDVAWNMGMIYDIFETDL